MNLLQTRRFTEQIEEIIPNNFSQKLKFENGLITQAQIKTPTKLKAAQLNALEYLANSWGFKDIEVSNSTTGVKIELIDFNQELFKPIPTALCN